MTNLLDRIYEWLGTALNTIFLDTTGWLTFPVLWIAVWAGLTLGVKALSTLGSRVFPFLLRVGAITGYVAMLTADYLVTRLFRFTGRRPFGLIYVVGETATRALPKLLDAIRNGGRRWRREAHTLANRSLLVFVSALLIAWWNGTYCERQTTPVCEPPSSSVTRPLSRLAQTVSAWIG